MTDADALRKLGWSEQLIDALKQAAAPMRETMERGAIPLSVTGVQSFSCREIYSDAVVNTTAREVTVVTPRLRRQAP